MRTSCFGELTSLKGYALALAHQNIKVHVGLVSMQRDSVKGGELSEGKGKIVSEHVHKLVAIILQSLGTLLTCRESLYIYRVLHWTTLSPSAMCMWHGAL